MKLLSSFYLVLFSSIALAQSTIGLIQYDIPNTDGYVFFSPLPSTKTYLIDKCGREIHEWNSTYHPGLAAYLLEDGSILRLGNTNNSVFNAGGSGGVIESFDWNGNLLWSYMISDSSQCQHHDAIALPSGNVLAIVWERHTKADAVQIGKNPVTSGNYVWSEKIVELQPTALHTANIVWEWKLWDHLIQDFDTSKVNYGGVSLHPELVNINFPGGPSMNPDWVHMNSIDYNPILDQVLVSSHNFDEIWIIDHSTTTAEAATHSGGNSGIGGDLMYRWGNVQAYDRGTATDQKFFGQHHATWIPSGYPDGGKIIVFNNGMNRPAGDYSSIDIIDPPLDSLNHYPIGMSSVFMPTNLYRSYTAPVPTDFFANNISGVYPLENGSFMVTVGPTGVFFELDSVFNTVWKYINPVNNAGPMTQGTIPSNNSVFRCSFYPPTYQAFVGVVLTPGNEIEINPTAPSLCTLLGTNELQNSPFGLFPNPSNSYIDLSIENKHLPFEIDIYNMTGKVIMHLQNQLRINISELRQGIYFVRIKDDETFQVIKFIKL